MNAAERIREEPCGCRYDVQSGLVTNWCAAHDPGEDDEPPIDDGPPYTDAVDDEDGMSELRNELSEPPEPES